MADSIVDRRPRDRNRRRLRRQLPWSRPTHPAPTNSKRTSNTSATAASGSSAPAAALHDAAGDLVGAIETFQDVTKRKQVEAELQRRVPTSSPSQTPNSEVLVSNVTDREKKRNGSISIKSVKRTARDAGTPAQLTYPAGGPS
jgi:hypothetical protein